MSWHWPKDTWAQGTRLGSGGKFALFALHVVPPNWFIVRWETGHDIYVIGLKNIRIHPSTRYRIRCGFIFSYSGPVHTYPDIFESATFSFRIRLPSTRIRRIRQRIRKKINPLSRVEKNISATNPITCWRVNPDFFLADDVKSVSSLSPNNKPIWRLNVEGE